jgi:hypothetical protein
MFTCDSIGGRSACGNGLFLTAVFLCLAIAGPAQAIKLEIDDQGSMWGYLKNITADGTTYTSVGAGRFHTKVMTDDKKLLVDTFSYCVDIKQSFGWDTPFSIVDTPMGDNYLLAAWLVYNYDPIIGADDKYDRYADGIVAQALQLAVWDAVYGGITVGTGNNSEVESLYGTMKLLNNVGSFTGSGFMLAKSEVSQDQLVAAPVPEPATMLLMGIGLLGLGVVGRKRIK